MGDKLKRKKRTLVDIQEDRVIRGSDSSYEKYSEDNHEDVLGNPDLLPEQSAKPSNPQLLMGEAIQHLQGRQKEVYLLVMREDKSIAEAAEILGIIKGTAQVHLERAVAFIKAYCIQAIEGGRV